MDHFNIELKAKCENVDEIREILLSQNADYKGKDHQIDTYYNSNNGRLKIRRGNIENSLVFYERNDNPSKKESKIILEQNPSRDLEKILENSLGIKVVVDKQREIYFINNVKFHIDYVEGLGNFIEIEAISENNKIPREKLEEQFDYYKKLLKINEKDLIDKSYSDILK
ncbi:MAG: class IV adenylate cyclase [Nanoarchaeota archaeon]|nr:class IV adenylate cyclase [Nanoarchaeota archaeon]